MENVKASSSYQQNMGIFTDENVFFSMFHFDGINFHEDDD